MTLGQLISVRMVMTRKAKMTKKFLREKKACYVLITCDDPTSDGKMCVEMSYEGDVNLAALMIDRAHIYIHEALEEA